MIELSLVWEQEEASQVSFFIIIGLHQGLTLSPYPFVLVMDELT